MKNEVKCYRCGHKIDVNSKNLSEQVTCPHCQGKMDLDKKTKTKYTVLRYIFIVLVSFVFVTMIFLKKSFVFLRGRSSVFIFSPSETFKAD